MKREYLVCFLLLFTLSAFPQIDVPVNDETIKQEAKEKGSAINDTLFWVQAKFLGGIKRKFIEYSRWNVSNTNPCIGNGGDTLLQYKWGQIILFNIDTMAKTAKMRIFTPTSLNQLRLAQQGIMPERYYFRDLDSLRLNPPIIYCKYRKRNGNKTFDFRCNCDLESVGGDKFFTVDELSRFKMYPVVNHNLPHFFPNQCQDKRYIMYIMEIKSRKGIVGRISFDKDGKKNIKIIYTRNYNYNYTDIITNY